MPPVPFPPGSLISAYFRDSGGDSQELSVPQQENAFRTWCAQNGLIPGAIFQDAARPGSTVIGRAGFNAMIHHFRSGAKEAGLVIWSYSRFARDFDDAQFYRADLRRRGYIFHSLNDSIPEGPMGRLFEAAIDWKNEQFLIDLSGDIKRGLYDMVRIHGGMPGTPPRGFRRVPLTIGKRRDGVPHIVHRWEPDPESMPRVQQAFSMRARGATLTEIQNATHLFSSMNSYQTMFANRLYIGDLIFGETVIPNYCPPAVDSATWDAVQAQLAAHSARMHLHRNTDTGNPQHPRRVNSRYLLSGLLFCARCGAPMFGASTRSKGVISDRYACTHAWRRHDCDLTSIPQKITDSAILEAVCRHILDPQTLAQNLEIMRTGQAAQQAQHNEQRSALQAQLAGIRRRSANITAAIAEAGHTRAMLEKLNQYESEETAVLSQLYALDRQAAIPLPEYTPEQISAHSGYLLTTLDTGELDTRQKILRGLIQRIAINRNVNTIYGEITYYTPLPETCSSNETELSITRVPLGALIHRQLFSTTFSATFRPNPYKKRS